VLLSIEGESKRERSISALVRPDGIRPVENSSRKIIALEHVLIEKVIQLFAEHALLPPIFIGADQSITREI
jgi:hypothetical protein